MRYQYTGYTCETGMAECWMTRSGVEVRYRGDGHIDDDDKFGVFLHGHELSTGRLGTQTCVKLLVNYINLVLHFIMNHQMYDVV